MPVLFILRQRLAPRSPLFPYTTLFRSKRIGVLGVLATAIDNAATALEAGAREAICYADRKTTRLNSSHGYISYAVFCLKKKTQNILLLTSDIRQRTVCTDQCLTRCRCH